MNTTVKGQSFICSSSIEIPSKVYTILSLNILRKLFYLLESLRIIDVQCV
uniref:Uncharacterized protein n=1 Tax=Lepeophtheirus salmonis TaxID=72036 RepID=A0A0K2UGM1_LEPSM